ncbi:MAG: phosphoglucosamine mutase [Clostridia bacterium]|nr:phosphoglucosamine mutase [Clostridia bacterium]
MSKLFGTDGVRGIANETLTCELAMKIGAAGASVIASGVGRPKILLGCDTRLSGDMLCAALVAGICSVGGDVLTAGIVPTPAIAYLVRLYSCDAAVMVSASHNTMEYNGIKWFDSNGFKLSDETEERIEKLINDNFAFSRPTGTMVGRQIFAKKAPIDYMDFLKEACEKDLSGMRIVLDCSNGAASDIAPELFSQLGATVYCVSNTPDGCNINQHCGSTHPEQLAMHVAELGADIGFAFDGDADRVIACDEYGNIVDGDRLMGICALFMKENGTLSNNTLVLTVMSNLGLRKAMESAGINVIETKVGDRYVLEAMLKDGHSIGGEQSGHIIFLDKTTTGDGMLSAIMTLNVIKKSGLSLSKLVSSIPQYPQVLVNVLVKPEDMQSIMDDPEVHKKVREIEAELNGDGRILIRKSGTEPLIRIMLEGRDQYAIELMALSMANLITERFGGKIRQ